MYLFICLFGFPSFKYLAPLTMLSSIFSTDRHCRHLELSHRGFSWSEQIGNFHSTCYQSLRSATLFLYALHNVTMTMPLENRMRTPHNLQRMLILNVSFNVFIVHDIRVPRLQQMHAWCLRHCSRESSQESVDVPWVDVFFFHFYRFSIHFYFIFILFFFILILHMRRLDQSLSFWKILHWWNLRPVLF